MTLRNCSLRVRAAWAHRRPRQTAVRPVFPVTRKESYVMRARMHERHSCATAHTLLQTHTVFLSLTHSLECCAHTQRAHARQHNTKLPRVPGAAVPSFRCSCEVALSLPSFGRFRPTPRAPPTLRATSSATSSSFFSASSTTPSNSSRMFRRS